MSAWPACSDRGQGVGVGVGVGVGRAMCVWISGSDRHTFTPHTPIASLLPPPRVSHHSALQSCSRAAIWSMDLQLFTFPFSPAASLTAAAAAARRTQRGFFQTFRL